MRLRDFIKENRADIDRHINLVLTRPNHRGEKPNPILTRNDSEREEWVQNDEGLYRWRRSTR